jgi:hypothetical protein
LASIVSAPEQEKDQIRNFYSEGYSDGKNGHLLDGSWSSITNLRARKQEFVYQFSITCSVLDINQIQKRQSQGSSAWSCLEQGVQVAICSVFGLFIWMYILVIILYPPFAFSFSNRNILASASADKRLGVF